MNRKRKPQFRNIVNESPVYNQTNGSTVQNMTVNVPADVVDDEAKSEPITMKASPKLKQRINQAAEDHGMARSEFIRKAVEVAVKYSDHAMDLNLDPDEMIEKGIKLLLQAHRYKSQFQDGMMRELSATLTGDLLKG